MYAEMCKCKTFFEKIAKIFELHKDLTINELGWALRNVCYLVLRIALIDL